MRILSLFDGISCGYLALQRAGIHIDEYHAYEIEPYAIKASDTNFPRIKQHGDVTKADFKQFCGFDLLIGGSPCQGFSSSGKQMNFDDPRSKLFFDFVRAKEEMSPTYFLLENVKMRKEWQDVISEYLGGVNPISINSSLVSAQNRERLYWTNIPGVKQPIDKGITLESILEETEWKNPAAIRGRKLNKATIIGRRLNAQGHREDYNKNIPITQCLEVRATNVEKSNCITTVDKDNVLTPLPPGRYPDAFKSKLPFRYYTTKEYCRLQTLPDDFLCMIPEAKARKAIGNAWTVDVIAHILSFLAHLQPTAPKKLYQSILREEHYCEQDKN